MTTLTPQELRAKFSGNKPAGFFDAPVTSRAISVLKDPEKLRSGTSQVFGAAGDIIRDFGEKNRQEQEAAMEGKTGFRRAGAQLGTQAKQGTRLALNFAREIAAGAAVITKSALPEAPEGAPKFGLSDEQQEKIFGRPINRIQESVFKPTQEFAEREGSGTAEKFLLPVIASLGAVAVESPVGLPAKQFPKKLITNLAKEVSGNSIEATLKRTIKPLNNDTDLLKRAVDALKKESNPKNVEKILKATRTQALKNTVPNVSRGTTGKAELKNIADDDLGEFIDFIDDVRAGKDPTVNNEIAVRRLSERFGINPDQSNARLANVIQKQIDAQEDVIKRVAKRTDETVPVKETPKAKALDVGDTVKFEGDEFKILDQKGITGDMWLLERLDAGKAQKIVDKSDEGLQRFTPAKEAEPVVEEIVKGSKSEVLSEPIKVFHGGTEANVRSIQQGDFIALRDPELKEAATGGNRVGLSTTVDADMARDFASGVGGRNIAELQLKKGAKVLNLTGREIDDLTEAEMKKLADEFDAVRDIDNVGGEGEIRILKNEALTNFKPLKERKLGEANTNAMYGAFVGFEVDEETGEISIDPVKAVLGMAGLALYTRHFKGGEKFLLKNLKKHPDFDRVESEVLTQMELAEAGQRIIQETGEVLAQKSTFPKWIPEHLRKKDLLDSVIKHMNAGTVPPAKATRQLELYEETIDEMAARLTVTHIDSVDRSFTGGSADGLTPDELMRAYDERAAEMLKKDKAEVNGIYSRTKEDGVLLQTDDLDTLNKIPDTPKQAFMFVRDGKVDPAFEVPDQTTFQYVRQQIQDKFERLGTVQKAITKQKKVEIPESMDAYLQQELYVGRAAEKVDLFRDEIITSTKKGKKSLMERMKDDKIDIEDMGEYLHARHAKERNAKVRTINEALPDGGSGLTDAQADEILKKYADNEKIAAYADEVYKKITTERLRILEESGLMTKEAVELIGNSYKDYIPLKVAGKEQIGGKGKGFSVSGKDVKRVKGSLKDRENPLIQAVVDYEMTVMKAEKNKVAQSFAKLVEMNPNPKLWEIESLKYRPRFDKNGEVIAMDPKFKFADNVMEVRFDGKIKLITIHDKELAKAMKNLGTEKAVSKTLLTINNYLRGVNTFYNPEFMITNFERDLQTALINIGGEQSAKMAANVAKDTLPAMKGIYKALRGKKPAVKKKGTDWSALYDEMRAEGGRVGWFDLNEVQKRTDETIKLIRRYNGDTTGDKALRAIDSAGKLVSDMNESVEMAVRLSTYKHAVDNGISKAKAAQLAKNLTVNFNKKGNMGTALNSLYLFANAGIQGGTRIIQALRHPRTRKIAIGIAAFSYGMAEINRNINQEQYDRISDFEKDTNLIFMLPDFYEPSGDDIKDGIISGSKETGYYLKLRLPYGYNMFKVIGDVAYNQVHQKKTPAEELKHFLLALDASFNPLSSGSTLQLVAPTVADPIVQKLENKNFFGSPIMPEQNQYAPAVRESSLYFKSARNTSKQVAEWLNDVTGGDEVKAGLIDISPETIDHYIDFIGGGLGKLIANTGDTAATLIEGEMPDVKNMPFVRKFVGETFEDAEKFSMFDLLDRSATRKLSDIERERFISDVEKALETEQINPDTGKRAIKEFLKNEAKLDAGAVFETVLKGTDEEVAAALEGLSPAARKELTELLKKEAQDRIDSQNK